MVIIDNSVIDFYEEQERREEKAAKRANKEEWNEECLERE